MAKAKHRRTASKQKVMRRWRLFFIAVIAFPLISGVVMVHLHGFQFFVFRSAGTGESPDSNLSENQGPGQVDAPGTLNNPFRFVATMPDGTKLTIKSTHHDTWAGVAQLSTRHGGHWVILADGSKFTQITHHTAAQWSAQEHHYRSEWILVPLKEVT